MRDKHLQLYCCLQWDSHAGMYEYRNIGEIETQTAGTNSNSVTDDANPLADSDSDEEIRQKKRTRQRRTESNVM